MSPARDCIASAGADRNARKPVTSDPPDAAAGGFGDEASERADRGAEEFPV